MYRVPEHVISRESSQLSRRVFIYLFVSKRNYELCETNMNFRDEHLHNLMTELNDQKKRTVNSNHEGFSAISGSLNF